MPGGAGWIRVWLVAERIKVQRFDDLAALVSDQPRTALAVFVDVQRLALSLFADELPYAIGGVRVARFLPCAAVLPVVAAPFVADGLRGGARFEQVAPAIPAVGGFGAVAVFFCPVACAVVAVAASCICA